MLSAGSRQPTNNRTQSVPLLPNFGSSRLPAFPAISSIPERIVDNVGKLSYIIRMADGERC
jgi:hypothetical protein